MVKKLLILTFILISSSFATAQIPMPLGIGGVVEVDNTPIGGITVQVENLNTGEVKITTTAYDTPYTKCGYYTVAPTGQNGDVIKVTVTYGNTYSNTVVVDTSQVTQFCNISISTEEPYDPPDDPPYNPPDGGNGDEPDEPEDPENNETEEPEPDENNTDNDVCNLYNLTVTVFDNTTNNPVGNASVTIYDNNETKITKSYTNESGEATFLLEEGIYIIEVEEGNHVSSCYTVNLLCSTEYTISMETEGDTNPTSAQEQESSPLYFYVIVAIAIIIIISICIYLYRRRSS